MGNEQLSSELEAARQKFLTLQEQVKQARAKIEDLKDQLASLGPGSAAQAEALQAQLAAAEAACDQLTNDLQLASVDLQRLLALQAEAMKSPQPGTPKPPAKRRPKTIK
jgi:septal ring factor EnvC (AmiA/AmiB activator)